MVKLAQEIDELCAVGYGMMSPSLSAANRLRNASLRWLQAGNVRDRQPCGACVGV